ncbi:MAG: hypothetical protein WBL23_08245 [Salinisphaera sp.]|uniref:hypothetical protein n=1 Tax=Salinisphaera sp. TaxID=1914330 RepID=UPI003C7A46A0
MSNDQAIPDVARRLTEREHRCLAMRAGYDSHKSVGATLDRVLIATALAGAMREQGLVDRLAGHCDAWAVPAERLLPLPPKTEVNERPASAPCCRGKRRWKSQDLSSGDCSRAARRIQARDFLPITLARTR